MQRKSPIVQHRQHATSAAPVRVHVPRRGAVQVQAGVLEPGATVLVAGATGGVGQLVTAKLLDRGFKVRAIARSTKSKTLANYGLNCEVVVADLRESGQVEPLFKGVSAVVSATGTTAFPSKRWEGNNGPRPTDWVASSNLINGAAKHKLARFVLVTSAGVERYNQLPYAILNTFGVLRYKREAELLLQKTGLPYTIIRPSRLTDGPYTSYDLNTLLQATSGTRRAVSLSLSDSFAGEASRIATAEAAVQALLNARTENQAYAIVSQEGDGPGEDKQAWDKVFAGAAP